MSNVERLSIQDETVQLLLNKAQRSRGDTLNSGASARDRWDQIGTDCELTNTFSGENSNCIGADHVAIGRDCWG
jgi:hypothetical protein